MPDPAVADATTTTTTTAATTSATVEPFYKDWLQADGSLNAKSYERLPDHLKSLRPTLERQNNIDGVLMALDHAQTLAGKKALAPLPPDAPEAVRTERKALLDGINGVPKTAKEYGITKPADIKDTQWNQKLVDGFANWAHKNSVSPAAVKELTALQIQEIGSQLKGQADGEQQFWAKEQTIFDGIIRNANKSPEQASAQIERGAVAAGLNLQDPQTQIFFKGAAARLLAMHLGEATMGDTTITGADTGAGSGKNLDDQIREARANPAYGNYDNKYSRSDHDSAVEAVNRLYRLKVSQEAKGRK